MAPVNAAIQGLVAAKRNLEKTADRISRRSTSAGESEDSVSLSEDAVGLLSARNAYETNLQVLKVADSMSKKLVDFLA
jgi:flagellar basal body rod protein FlgG